jgi:GNAT superfamily N-acetyltransferase
MMIREATKNDFEAVAKLHHELDKLETGWHPYPVPSMDSSRKWLKKRFGKKNTVVFVADNNGKIVGFLYGWIEKRDYHYRSKKFGVCSDIFISSGYRRNGVGRKLIKKFEEWCKRKGLKYLELSTNFKNEVARKFYPAMGFEEYEVFYMKKLK